MTKKILSLLLLSSIIFLLTLNLYAEEESEKTRIVVLPLGTENVNSYNIDKALAGEMVMKSLIDELLKTQRFNVPEYEEVITLVKDIKPEGILLNRDEQMEIAQVLGADFIITGYISQYEVNQDDFGISMDSAKAKVKLEIELISGLTGEKIENFSEKSSQSSEDGGKYIYYDIDPESMNFYGTILGQATVEANEKVAEKVVKIIRNLEE